MSPKYTVLFVLALFALLTTNACGQVGPKNGVSAKNDPQNPTQAAVKK